MTLRESVIQEVLRDPSALRAIPPKAIPQRAVGTSRVTALPQSPVEGDEVRYLASAGVMWSFAYYPDGSAYPWLFIGGPPIHSTVITGEATTSTSFAALATAGPSITAPVAGFYDLRMGARITAASGEAGLMTLQTADVAAADANALLAGGSASTVDTSPSVEHRFEVTAGDAVTALYRSTGGASMTFTHRTMRLIPVRVGR